MLPITTCVDLLDQDVDVIVNPWNRNLIPWWLLLPKGVSGAIKKRAGYRPFIELRRHGVLPLGAAVLTSAGNLPHRGIIHVAGIGHAWTTSETTIRRAVQNALRLASESCFRTIAFPLIGAGNGGANADRVAAIMEEEIPAAPYAGEARIVNYREHRGEKGAATDRSAPPQSPDACAPVELPIDGRVTP